MKKNNTVLLLILCQLLLGSKFINAQCHIDDWTALKALYEATDGDNWTNNYGWEIVKSNEPPLDCNLENLKGIRLNANGRVNVIIFDDENLSGNIPPELGNLTNLNYIGLSHNQLSGSIPVELGNLTNLNILYLSGNQLSGKIPPELANLSNLVSLSLSNNKLTGNIPAELGNLDSLDHLYLNNNQLTGNIPNEFSNLSLSYLGVANNQLSGKVPYIKIEYDNDLVYPFELYFQGNYFVYEDFENYEEDYTFLDNFIVTPQYFSHNAERNIVVDTATKSITLSAPFEKPLNYIYQWFKNDLKITGANDSILHLDNVQLEDLGIYKLYLYKDYINSLERLYISDPITVSLDDENCHIDDWTALKALYETTDGDNWKNKTGWEIIKTEKRPYNCDLRNLFGVKLNNNSRVDRLNLNQNNLTGEIPIALQHLNEVFEIDLKNNNLEGNIPNEFTNLLNLQTCYLSNNQLNGNIPVFPPNSRLTYFEIQSNYFTCDDIETYSRSFFNFKYSPQKYKHSGLKFHPAKSSTDSISLNAPYNGSGIIYYSWRKNGIYLDNENDSILHLTNIQREDLGSYSLHIVNNGCVESTGLDGKISNVAFIADPIKVGNYCHIDDWTALKALYEATDGDNWTDNYGWEIVKSNEPPLDCDLGNLNAIQLDENGIIEAIWLANNNLNGSIPIELTKLNKLNHLKLGNNQLSGSIPAELGNLNELLSLSLSNNELTGNIPSELGNLNNLGGLFLNNNKLNGNIPSELGNLSKLLSLYLSNNKLTGGIPPEIGDLSSLHTLYLSNNQLTGNIPNEFSNLSLSYFDVSHNQLSGKIPYINVEYDPHFDIWPFEFYFENNYFTYNDFEIFEEDHSFIDNFIITPQYYKHNAEKNISINASTKTISLSAPFEVGYKNGYQWYKNDLKIIGATDSILSVKNVELDDVGVYKLHIYEEYMFVHGMNYISDPINVRRVDLEGCTDINSCNYNEAAIINDGSCEYLTCNAKINPIKIRTTNEIVLSETQVKYDLIIDSLNLNYSADGLTFTLDTKGNYNIERVEVINDALSIDEVNTSQLDYNTISIDRKNSQTLSSNLPLLRITACIVVDDIPTDEASCTYFEIYGGTQISNEEFIDFQNIYFDIPFSDCLPVTGYGSEGINWLPLVTSLSPQNCSFQNTGTLEIKILEEGVKPFNYTLRNEQGYILLEGQSSEKFIELNNIAAGSYSATVNDNSGKQTSLNISVPLITNVDGSNVCNSGCVDYLVIPNGEITGTHFAKKEVDIKGFISGSETVEINICD